MGILMDERTMTNSQMNNQVNEPPKPLARDVRPQSVARLLGITLDPGHADDDRPDEMMAELLQARLADPWVPNHGRQRAWPKLVRQWLHKSSSDGQKTIGDILLDSRAQLSTIKEIRDRAKAQVAREHSEPEQAVMTTIYFAAIANALAYRGAKITTYSYESLESSFEKLIRKVWMPADFAELFRRAVASCRDDRTRPGSK